MGGRSKNSKAKYRKTKPQRILIRCGFLVGAGGLREPRRKGTRVAAPNGCIVPWAARASCWPQPQQLLPVSAAGSGRRCCTGAFFTRRTTRRVDAVRIHPCSPFFKADKTETPVPIGYRSPWWARVDCASRAAKNSPLGCFYAVFCDSAAAVRIHPLYEFSLVTKQKPQRTCIR